MNEVDIIEDIMREFDTTKRHSRGRDTNKNYHKITISINKVDKIKIMDYAKENEVSVSALIKDLLREKHII